MTAPNSPPNPPRASRRRAASSSPGRPNRLAFRLIGIPALAVAGVLIYRGVRDRFVLPDCDSARAKQTLEQIFKQLRYQPLHFKPITTVSKTKDEVVCHALLPLADGANLEVDYSLFWQGGKANMRYSIARREPQHSGLTPPRAWSSF